MACNIYRGVSLCFTNREHVVRGELSAVTGRPKHPASVPPDSFPMQLQLLYDINQHAHLPVPVYEPNV